MPLNRQKDLPEVSAFLKRLIDSLIPAIAALLALAASGCQLPPSSTTCAKPQAVEDTAYRNVLAKADGWSQSVRRREDDRSEPRRRWRHQALEDLLSRPDLDRRAFRAALADKDPIVAANAAIALARLGDASGETNLAAAVRSPELKMPIRAAAAEALATLGSASSVERLRELIDQYGNFKRKRESPYFSNLHAELVHGLAQHVDVAAESRLLDAIHSPDAGVRLVAIEAWAAGGTGTLPREVAELAIDPDYRVRAVAMRLVARRRVPGAMQYLVGGLRDPRFQVRTAAIAGLGELGGVEAEKHLRAALKDRSEAIRAAAVSALAAVGADQAVFRAADDKSWRVRAAVAEALPRYADGAGAALAKRLLDDTSVEVQQRVIAATAQWPLPRAGPILLAAMGKDGFMTRKNAAAGLAARWAPAESFPFAAPKDRRDQQLRQLNQRFREAFAGVVATGVVTAGGGTGVSPVLRQKHGQDARATRSQVFEALDRLRSEDVEERRRAAGRIAALAADEPLGRLAVARLADLMVKEPDRLVLWSVLQAIATDGSEPANRLARAAIGHPSPEVRRRACEHLAAHPDPRHVEVLLPVLEDPSGPVVVAAVRAVAAAGRFDDTGPLDTGPLERLLVGPNELLHVEVAAALVRLGNPRGNRELLRLAHSRDETVRRRVAEAMGVLADRMFAPTLIRLLDDRVSVRRAALASLPKVAGENVAPGATNTADRIELWKQWSQRQ
jgi:HEAT repeat protein